MTKDPPSNNMKPAETTNVMNLVLKEIENVETLLITMETVYLPTLTV